VSLLLNLCLLLLLLPPPVAVQGDGHVHVLDMATDLQALRRDPAPTTSKSNSSSSRSSSSSSGRSTTRRSSSSRPSGGSPYSTQQLDLPWQLLLSRTEEMDVLAVDHANNGTFLLLVDSDAAPDGQLLAVSSSRRGGQEASGSSKVGTDLNPGSCCSCCCCCCCCACHQLNQLHVIITRCAALSPRALTLCLGPLVPVLSTCSSACGHAPCCLTACHVTAPTCLAVCPECTHEKGSSASLVCLNEHG
jgi:hypothetical protein